MKRSFPWAVWLWAVQAVTGLLLVLYVVIHTIDNAAILVSQKAFEDMLKLWHEGIPVVLYQLMVIGLVGVIVVHMLNGIRIASKPYKDIEVTWRHNIMLRHSGTMFWLLQVLSGSVIAIFAVWHLIEQHAGEPTNLASQSAARLSPWVFLMYLMFIAALMFHSFNGVRAVIIKLGIMTDRAKESILVGLVALMFIIFFGAGVLSMQSFLKQHSETKPPPGHNTSMNEIDGSGKVEPADRNPNITSPRPRGE